MNKSYVLLCLYEKLQSGKGIQIETCCKEFGISVPTFRRYISILRDFFWEKHNSEIKYDIKQKEYRVEYRKD